MTSPKRAETANEHAERLREVADLDGGPRTVKVCTEAAAEIERLAARVMELEEDRDAWRQLGERCL